MKVHALGSTSSQFRNVSCTAFRSGSARLALWIVTRSARLGLQRKWGPRPKSSKCGQTPHVSPPPARTHAHTHTPHTHTVSCNQYNWKALRCKLRLLAVCHQTSLQRSEPSAARLHWPTLSAILPALQEEHQTPPTPPAGKMVCQATRKRHPGFKPQNPSPPTPRSVTAWQRYRQHNTGHSYQFPSHSAPMLKATSVGWLLRRSPTDVPRVQTTATRWSYTRLRHTGLIKPSSELLHRKSIIFIEFLPLYFQ